MFNILNEIKKSEILEVTNQFSSSPEKVQYKEEDLREHLKLTCGIIIDDISDHWSSYHNKFIDATFGKNNKSAPAQKEPREN